MPDLMPMVHAERHALADYLDTLAPEQWTAATWCEQWNVQEVVGHLTAAGNIDLHQRISDQRHDARRGPIFRRRAVSNDLQRIRRRL